MFTRIKESDFNGKSVKGLPDVPGLGTADMQAILVAPADQVLMPAFNRLADELEAETAAASLGAKFPEGYQQAAEGDTGEETETEPPNIQAVLDAIAKKAAAAQPAEEGKGLSQNDLTNKLKESYDLAADNQHTHENKELLDQLSAEQFQEYQSAADALNGYYISEEFFADPKALITGEAIAKEMEFAGGGDMMKSRYDPTGVGGDAFLASNHKLTGYEDMEMYDDIVPEDDVLTAIGKLAIKPARLDNVRGLLAVERGGTDAEDAATARQNLGAAGKSSVITATLAVASWSGTAAPYTYVLTVNGVTTTSNQEVLPSLSITAAQLEALQAANIQDGGQAANTITLKAFGDKPTVAIPIRVIIRGDA